MRNQKLETMNQSRLRLSRQLAAGHEAERGAMADVQRDPTAQLSCRVGDGSCAGAHAETLNRATLNRATLQTTPNALLRLQREYGNRFVQRVVDLSRQGEGEADVTSEVEQRIQSARGGGQALDSGVRAQMEPAFGANFGGVRVHNNAGADSLNRSLSARAFTTGQDIFFKRGEYSPGSSGGRELIAHELTHVVQQNGDQVQAKLTLGQPGDRYEQEADSVARAVIQQEQRPVQKQDEEGEEEIPAQTKLEDAQIQRQAEAAVGEEEEEEETVQTQSLDEREEGLTI